MKFHIETPRLLLREIKDSDLEGMFALDSNPIVHQYLGNKPVTEKAQSIAYINHIKQQYNTLGIGRFAVEEKATGNFIGWSGIKFNTGAKEMLGEKRDFYDIGYRLIPKYWNLGYASESAIASLHFAFTELQLEKIYGAAETKNIASNKILQKIGLQFVEEFPFDNVFLNWYELKKENYGKTVLRV
ncbi:MAG: GNAT family N-acetyltransferase [Oceanihabitans sp.]